MGARRLRREEFGRVLRMLRVRNDTLHNGLVSGTVPYRVGSEHTSLASSTRLRPKRVSTRSQIDGDTEVSPSWYSSLAPYSHQY